MTGSHITPQLSPPQKAAKGIGAAIRRIPIGLLVGLGVLIVAALIPLSIWFTAHAQDTQTALDSANSDVTAVKSQAAPLAGAVQNLCDQGGAAATELNAAQACSQASKVQSVIAEPGPSGPPGPSGANGSNGRGIASTHLASGDLIVVYTDGSSTDVGTVTGPQGGNGKDGRGISGSAIVGTDLVITYSDGTSSDLGNVVGPAGASGSTGATGPAGSNGSNGSNGVGVSSVVINSAGHLIVSYTDASTSDAGPVPQAQACPNGSAPSTTSITEPSGLSSTTVNGVLVCGG